MIEYLCASLLWSMSGFVLGVIVGGAIFGNLPNQWRHR